MHMKGMMVTLVTLLMALSSIGQLFLPYTPIKHDYQPGEVVIIEGDGWRPGEQVRLEIDHSNHYSREHHIICNRRCERAYQERRVYYSIISLGRIFHFNGNGFKLGVHCYDHFYRWKCCLAPLYRPTSVASGASATYTVRVSNISVMSTGSGERYCQGHFKF